MSYLTVIPAFGRTGCRGAGPDIHAIPERRHCNFGKRCDGHHRKRHDHRPGGGQAETEESARLRQHDRDDRNGERAMTRTRETLGRLLR